ncbi:MAG: SDR family oxidoreductase [Rhodospirillales bacterium]|nr:SDR family oxidoreductase [Rhodospirillales bacterium]
MKGIAGKVVLITGAAGAIGQALVARFAEEKAAIAVCDLDRARAQAVAERVTQAGGTAQAFAFDITDHGAVTAQVAAVEAALGPIDILVNNAGWDQAGLFIDTTPDLWAKIIAINLVGPLNLQHAVLPGFVARKQGSIINIASDAGKSGSSAEAVYSACKGGVIAFTKTLAREVVRHNIRVNAVCPGPTDTPFLQAIGAQGALGKKLVEGLTHAIPMRRLGRPDDMGGVTVFLASDEASYITGQAWSVSGGLTMI